MALYQTIRPPYDEPCKMQLLNNYAARLTLQIRCLTLQTQYLSLSLSLSTMCIYYLLYLYISIYTHNTSLIFYIMLGQGRHQRREF
jgi:hypothetical protein